jgi:hypothetical protein
MIEVRAPLIVVTMETIGTLDVSSASMLHKDAAMVGAFRVDCPSAGQAMMDV